MAGRPQKRRREKAQAQAAAKVAPPLGTPTYAHDPGVRERARTRVPDLGAGPEVRAVSDRAQAAALAQLSQALNIGVTVRIERVRPGWCRGIIEDYTLEAEGMADLLEYLRAEHGGQAYRVTYLAENGAPVFSSSIPIPGPPRDYGRIINREQYEAGTRGESQKTVSGSQQPNNGQGGDALGGLAAILTLVLNEARESRNATLDAVKEMTNKTADTTEGLIKQFVERQTEERKAKSFPAQLEEFSESMHAVEEIKNTLTPEPAEPTSPMHGAMKEAGSKFFQSVLESQFQPAGQQQPGPGARQQQPPSSRIPVAGTTKQ